MSISESVRTTAGGSRPLQATKVPESSIVRPTKRQQVHLGLCIGYSGVSFRGLQLQTHGPTHETVEGILLQALSDIGILTLQSGKPREASMVMLSRSCRTDRGVHAIRNLVTLHIPSLTLRKAIVRYGNNFSRNGSSAEEEENCKEGAPMSLDVFHSGLNALTNALNEHLPHAIRVFKLSLLASHFVPRHCCNRRVYRYLLPAYALTPPVDSWATLLKHYPNFDKEIGYILTNFVSQQGEKVESVCPHSSFPLSSRLISSLPSSCEEACTTSSESPSLTSWVKDLAAAVENSNRMLQKFVVGSHRFHNFCVDAEVGGKMQSLQKVIPAWSDEAVRHVYRCEVVPQVYLLPTHKKGPSRRDWERYSSEDKPREDSSILPPTVDPISTGDCKAADGSMEPSVSSCSSSLSWFLPFLIFQIEGNSFLFNMIRKVVGTLLATCRGTRESVWDDVLSPTRSAVVPLAPGPYLLLSLSSYHGYDRRLQLSRRSKLLSDKPLDSSSCNPFRGETACYPLQQEWSGCVAEKAERFLWNEIVEDIVDIDLRRTPDLDTLLRQRNDYLYAHRPAIATEEAHLCQGIPIRKEEERAKQVQVATGNGSPSQPSSSILPSSSPFPSEMTKFLRGLRMHNWVWRDAKLPVWCGIEKESNRMAKRRKALEGVQQCYKEAEGQEFSENMVEKCAILAPEGMCGENENSSSTGVVKEEEEEAYADGWIYWGDSVEDLEERKKARALSVLGKRSRKWEV